MHRNLLLQSCDSFYTIRYLTQRIKHNKCVPKAGPQWLRGLRRRSSAARLLRLWVRIPPWAWMFVVIVVCCQVEVSATD